MALCLLGFPLDKGGGAWGADGQSAQARVSCEPTLLQPERLCMTSTQPCCQEAVQLLYL